MLTRKFAFCFITFSTMFFLVLLFFSCKFTERVPRSETLVAILNYNVIDLDPAEVNDFDASTVLCILYEQLLRFDSNLKPIPFLAESWDVEDDLHYTFHIKKGVLFHSGKELTSSDVKFSLLRAIDSDGLGYLFTSIDKESFKIIDNHTIKFSLHNKDRNLLMSLCHTAASIVSEKDTKAKTNGKTSLSIEPVGTGPFKINFITEGNILLERFEGYHGARPYFKFIKFISEERINKRISALKDGTADIICNLNTFELEKCKDNGNLKILTTQGFGAEYLGMNMRISPLDNINVRRAIAKGIDVKLINQVISNGFYESASSPYSPVIPYSIANIRKIEKRDIEGAKNLLAEAGYPQGLNLTLTIAESFERMEMASKIKEQLWRIGIHLEMKVLEWEDFLNELTSGKSQLFLIGYSPDLPDPDSALHDYFHSTSACNNGNYMGCADDELDILIDEGRIETDEKQREIIYKKAQERIMDLVPAVFMYYDKIMFVMPRHYEGIEISPLGFQYLAYIKPILESSE